MIVYLIFWFFLFLFFFGAAKLVLSGLTEQQFIELMANPFLLRSRSRPFKGAEKIVFVLTFLILVRLYGSGMGVAFHDYFSEPGLRFYPSCTFPFLPVAMVILGIGILLLFLAARLSAPTPQEKWTNQPMLSQMKYHCRQLKYFALFFALFAEGLFFYNLRIFTDFEGEKILHRKLMFDQIQVYEYEDIASVDYGDREKEGISGKYVTISFKDGNTVDLWGNGLSAGVKEEDLTKLITKLGKYVN